jgi:HEAT repeat protein
MGNGTTTDAAAAGADLTSDKASVRERALDALGQVRTVESVSAIADRLRQDRNGNVRRRAAAVLGDLGLPAAVPILADTLLRRDEEPFIRAEAAAALGKLGDAAGLEALGRVLVEERDDKVRWAAARAIHAVRSAEAADPLVRLLDTAGASDSLRGYVVKVLGDVGGAPAIARLQTAAGDRNPDVRKAALSALRTAANGDAVPTLSRALAADPDAGVRRRASQLLGEIADARALSDLCKAVLEDADEAVRTASADALARTGTWNARAAAFLRALGAGTLQRAGVDAERVVLAIAAPVEPDQFLLADHLIGEAIGKDERMTGVLAGLVIACCGGNLGVAGERLNRYQQAKGVTDDVMRALRIEIGGRTALDPVMKILQADLQEYFRLPIARLNESTQQHWERTVRYAQYGVIARVAMSIVVFLLGMGLLSVASWKLMFGNPDTTQLFGAGVSFVSGLGAMLMIVYSGPLREIRDSVSGLGISSAAFIAYIHRVLQISHTFSFYYLNGQMSFDLMKQSSELIRDSMADTIGKLAVEGSSASSATDTAIRSALAELRPRAPGAPAAPKSDTAAAA